MVRDKSVEAECMYYIHLVMSIIIPIDGMVVIQMES